ncbi:MAG TPA: hypothetical protein DDZ69_07190 [Porphyromonadaceae bacterium]|nr:hypothetical protein [Porphyromonadaceae bacterium]
MYPVMYLPRDPKLTALLMSGMNHFMNVEDAIRFVYPRAGHKPPSNIEEDAYHFIDKYLK